MKVISRGHMLHYDHFGDTQLSTARLCSLHNYCFVYFSVEQDVLREMFSSWKSHHYCQGTNLSPSHATVLHVIQFLLSQHLLLFEVVVVFVVVVVFIAFLVSVFPGLIQS